MIDALTFLYLVLAFGLIPVFVILTMILWRIYKNMDRIDKILLFTEQIMEFTRNVDKVPSIIANKFIATINRFF